MSRRLLAVTAALALIVVGIGGAVAAGTFDDARPSTAAMGSGHDNSTDSGGGDGMDMDMSMDMQMVENGTVVNENVEKLPPGCEEIAGERSITVRGGVAYSKAGEMFAFNRDRLEVDPCSRVTVTFHNEDETRHQWMIHGLPKETYPMGMFNIEVDGPASVTATFIAPGEATTLHTHCSLPQHEQKGMEMSLVVGGGGDSDGHDHEH